MSDVGFQLGYRLGYRTGRSGLPTGQSVLATGLPIGLPIGLDLGFQLCDFALASFSSVGRRVAKPFPYIRTSGKFYLVPLIDP
jgi:hypothetical protein